MSEIKNKAKLSFYKSHHKQGMTDAQIRPLWAVKDGQLKAAAVKAEETTKRNAEAAAAKKQRIAEAVKAQEIAKAKKAGAAKKAKESEAAVVVT